MKKLSFFSLMFVFLTGFCATTWSFGLKIPNLPMAETAYQEKINEMEISVEVEINLVETGNSFLPKSFPNLAEKEEPQFPPNYQKMNSFYPTKTISDEIWDIANKEINSAIANLPEDTVSRREEKISSYSQSTNPYSTEAKENKIWSGVKGTWNGPMVHIVTKITTKSNNGFLSWIVIHSFFDSIADAKAHSRGQMKYFSGDGDWHIWKNCQHFAVVMATTSFARRIFIEKITLSEGLSDLAQGGTLRFVFHNTIMKIVKGGFPAYNDPRYNQHTLPYWWFEDGRFTDKYISSGKFTTPLYDVLALGLFASLKTGSIKKGLGKRLYFTKTWNF
jgi:hypothetical protein